MSTKLVRFRGFGWKRVKTARRDLKILFWVSLVLLLVLVASRPLYAQNKAISQSCPMGELPKNGPYRPLGGLDDCMLDLDLGDGIVIQCLYKNARVWCNFEN